MGLFNPFTFHRKVKTATNALLAAYTFEHLDAARQRLVLEAAKAQAPFWFDGNEAEKLATRQGRIVFCNLIALSLWENNIRPSLGNELWCDVKNPFVESIGAEDLIDQIKRQLENKYQITIDIDS